MAHLDRERVEKERKPAVTSWVLVYKYYGTDFLSLILGWKIKKRNTSERFYPFWKVNGGKICTIWISNRFQNLVFGPKARFSKISTGYRGRLPVMFRKLSMAFFPEWEWIQASTKDSSKSTDGLPVCCQHGIWLVPARLWTHCEVYIQQ